MRITSRVLVPWHGAELLESAVNAPTEGIGLTSTDPAFFDDADLADGAGFDNGWVCHTTGGT
ncbi:hypothetical protein EFD55_01355 [Rhizobium pisi]|uniref:Uncharacterized protein n=2 Tax=Rhizobium TaxID=379 RepID=A0ABY0BA55_9HYPH|nr:hypothetical protein EFD55_01355 [Rhizobium pisi]RUM13041.1 hypothetical protein EFB14_12080 [Rhizobium fabae]TCA62952.1 hypothetical protein E0J16_01345 [Rhizobium pisi]